MEENLHTGADAFALGETPAEATEAACAVSERAEKRAKRGAAEKKKRARILLRALGSAALLALGITYFILGGQGFPCADLLALLCVLFIPYLWASAQIIAFCREKIIPVISSLLSRLRKKKPE